jgi:hypothetical protein
MSDRREPPIEGPAEARLSGYRYGVVLLLLLATFLFMTAGLSGKWVPLVTVVLEGATLLAALDAARARRRLVRVARVVVAVGLISGTLAILLGTDPRGELFLLNALLVGAAPVVIAQSILRRRVIDLRTVLGAICIYILIGMVWASLYSAIGALDSRPFFVQIEKKETTTADYLYFSYVTQTTVGYGDLTAARSVGRALAVLEALIGQLYLVTVVALLVGRLGPRRLQS